jgi:hypothetical protein
MVSAVPDRCRLRDLVIGDHLGAALLTRQFREVLRRSPFGGKGLRNQDFKRRRFP